MNFINDLVRILEQKNICMKGCTEVQLSELNSTLKTGKLNAPYPSGF